MTGHDSKQASKPPKVGHALFKKDDDLLSNLNFGTATP